MLNDVPLSAMWSSSSPSLTTGSQDLGYDNNNNTTLKNATPLPKVLDNSKTQAVDVLYLDNTYNNPEYDHPPRAVALERIVKLVTEIEPERPVILLLDSLGKEDVVIALSQATKSKVYLHKDRYNDWLKLGFKKEYVCNSLGENESTRVRVLPKAMGRHKENVCGPLVAGLKNFKEWGPLVISPTGWARHRTDARGGRETRDGYGTTGKDDERGENRLGSPIGSVFFTQQLQRTGNVREKNPTEEDYRQHEGRHRERGGEERVIRSSLGTRV